ncbi:MAG: HAMP domain-containing histidine kinase [Proteobacteria bacterium]|nr:HAMP domain-containing histidine kinase [Pseudomonadota bacterium]
MVRIFPHHVKQKAAEISSYIAEQIGTRFLSRNDDTLASWRERVFFSIFFCASIIGALSCWSSVFLTIQMGRSLNAIFYLFIYLLVLAITFNHKMPFRLRVTIGLLIFYSYGMVQLTTIGPLSSGRIWLFALTVIATLLLGLHAGLIALLIEIVSFWGIGRMLDHQILFWKYSPLFNASHLTTISITFLLLTLVVIFPLGMIVSGREKLLLNKIKMAKELKEKETALIDSLERLKTAQDQIVQSEKMGAIGNVLSAVTREINTPVGVGFTAASFLHQRTEDMIRLCQKGEIDGSKIEKYLNHAHEISTMIHQSTSQVSALVSNMDQLTIDQSTESTRVFFLKEYLEEIIMSVRIKTKKYSYKVEFDCPEGLKLNTYPGPFFQIISQLIMNSVSHGFQGTVKNIIKIVVYESGENFVMEFIDNGIGMAVSELGKIFEPFFTTRKSEGYSGFGMQLVYSLVKNILKGHIKCESSPGNGMRVFIEAPMDIKRTNRGHENNS